MDHPSIYDASGTRAGLLESLRHELTRLRTLEQVLAWARSATPPYRVAEIVTQDEYTHDVVIAVNRGYLAFDTT